MRAMLRRVILWALHRPGYCRCGLPLLVNGKWCTGGHFQREAE